MPFYPSYPDHRMAYHLDGTEVYRKNTDNSLVQLNNTQISYLNDESDSTSYNVGAGAQLVFIFPQLRDLTNYFIATNGGGASTFEVSSNTTNGVDGSWTTIASLYILSSTTSPDYRTVNSVSASAIKGIRIKNGSSISRDFSAIHFFGVLASGETPSRLDLWHPTLNQRVSGAHFDFGDTSRGETTNISFRVKNVSSTETASSILVQRATIVDSSPPSIGNYTLNLNGGSFAATQTISSLSPGSISDILILRQTNPIDAATSVWAGYVSAVVSSWA